MVTINAAATETGLKWDTIYRWIVAGRLTCQVVKNPDTQRVLARLVNLDDVKRLQAGITRGRPPRGRS